MSLMFLETEDLGAWIERMRADYAVFAPVPFEGVTTFRALSDGELPDFGPIAANSIKGAVFPQTETLMRIETRKNPENLSEVEYDISYSLAKLPRVVLGGRPCDARSLKLLDVVFDAKVKDIYYLARRERTFTITLACAKPDNSCFCTGTGGGPYDEQGSDAMLYPVEGGWLVKPLTPEGEKLLKLAKLKKPGKREAESKKLKAAAEAYLAGAPDMTGAEAAFWKLFKDDEFWDEATAGCLRCRICAYLCPACTCFNITDEESGLHSERIRTWDHCMSYMFTQEASGHNPRAAKISRMRNRIGHKFCYFPEIHGGMVSCTGCGRCIRGCPAGIDIREIVSAMKGHK